MGVEMNVFKATVPQHLEKLITPARLEHRKVFAQKQQRDPSNAAAASVRL
jgi:hypothetical protein